MRSQGRTGLAMRFKAKPPLLFFTTPTLHRKPICLRSCLERCATEKKNADSKDPYLVHTVQLKLADGLPTASRHSPDFAQVHRQKDNFCSSSHCCIVGSLVLGNRPAPHLVADVAGPAAYPLGQHARPRLVCLWFGNALVSCRYHQPVAVHVEVH